MGAAANVPANMNSQDVAGGSDKMVLRVHVFVGLKLAQESK